MITPMVNGFRVGDTVRVSNPASPHYNRRGRIVAIVMAGKRAEFRVSFESDGRNVILGGAAIARL